MHTLKLFKLVYLVIIGSIFISSSLLAQEFDRLTGALVYNSFLGANLEIGMDEDIYGDFDLNFSGAYNLNKAFALRATISYERRLFSVVNSGIGIGYSFERFVLSSSDFEADSHNLEFPIIFEFPILKKLRLTTAVIGAINLNGEETSRIFDGVRLGVQYSMREN